jgi:hypothetical protein
VFPHPNSPLLCLCCDSDFLLVPFLRSHFRKQQIARRCKSKYQLYYKNGINGTGENGRKFCDLSTEDEVWCISIFCRKEKILLIYKQIRVLKSFIFMKYFFITTLLISSRFFFFKVQFEISITSKNVK